MIHRGEVARVAIRAFADARTRREVRQVSPDGCANATNYFYMTSFTPDDAFLLYNSTAPGTNQVHAVHLDTGDTHRLTAITGGIGPHSWNLHPAGRELFYVAERCARAMDIETGEIRTVFDPARHPWMKDSGVTPPLRFSGDGKWLCFQFTHDPHECVAPNMWSHHGLVRHARSGIVRVACDGSAASRVYLHNEDMQHVMFCPADPDLITFGVWPDYQNHAQLPDNHRARAWIVDVKADFARPWLIMPKGHRATHEYWSPAGDRLFYHKRKVDDIWSPPRWIPCWISHMDRATGEHADFFMSETQHLNHSTCTPDGARVVTDNDDFRNPNELLLVDVKTGKSEVLWWRNMACRARGTQDGGPVMSTTGKWVAATSDCSGEQQVYITAL